MSITFLIENNLVELTKITTTTYLDDFSDFFSRDLVSDQ